MKIQPKHISGNVLFATLFTTGILSLFLGSYLSLVRSENQFTSRSQTWNATIPLAEAGVEEAMTQIKATYPTLSTANGWQLVNGRYMKTYNFNPDEFYTVGIFPPGSPNETTPVIVSQGFVRVPGKTNFISRTVRVNTKLNGPPLNGMVVVTTADINGNQISVDSFNSTNSAFSTDGKYDISKRRDKALLATLSSLTNAIDLGNAKVWGKVASAYTGTAPKVGPNSSIGNLAWHQAGNKGIQDGAYANDVNMSVLKPVAPYTSALKPPSALGISVLGSGDYAVDNLSGTVLVTGKARLLVTKTFDVSSLIVSNVTGTASLELYVAAPTVDISKGGLNVQGRASNLKIYGLSTNSALGWPGSQTLTAGGNGELTAMIYAPDTKLVLKGGGSFAQDFSGACVVKSVEMKGNYNFHFDESCALEMDNGYVAISWDELAVSWDTILAQNLSTKYLY
jgi:hypothetical protein